MHISALYGPRARMSDADTPPGGAAPPAANPPAGDPPKDDPAAAYKQEAEKLRQTLDKVLADQAKAKAEADKRRKDKDNDDALKRGEHEKVIEKLKADLEATSGRLTAFETESKARLDAKIAALPEAIRGEIEIVREHLPLTTLEKLVDSKMTGTPPKAPQGDPPPSPNPAGPSRPFVDGHQLHNETIGLLESIDPGGTSQEIGKKIGLYKFGNEGDHKVRWKGTGNDQKDTASFIQLLNAISKNPLRDIRDAARERIKKL